MRALSDRMATGTDVVLVVDIGTSSGRAALVDRSGSIRHQASHRHSLSPGADGSGAFDAPGLLRAVESDVAAVLTEARTTGERVVGVAVTSVRGAFLLLDAAGAPVWTSGSLDERAIEDRDALLPHEPAFHEATGQRLTFAALPRLQGLARRDPETFRSARTLLTIDAWLGRWLTGTDAIAAPSAAPTGLLRRDAAEWLPSGPEPWRPSEAVLALLPGVRATGTTVGVTCGLVDLGLPDGIPVAAAGGDAQMAALGLGCVAPGDTAVVMGSHWQTIVVTGRPAALPAPGRLIHGHGPGMWHADRVTMRVGIDLDAVWPDASADEARTAAWRARLDEGCARVAAGLTETAASLPGVPRADRVRVGGGAARDARVRAALEAALGVPVAPAATHEASVLGTAMCAAVTAGWATDPAHAARTMITNGPVPSMSTANAREA